MFDSILPRLLLSPILFVATATAVTTAVDAQGREKQKRPSFKAVKQTVEKTFHKFPEYKPGRLIVRSEVKKAFAAVKELGWNIPDQGVLLERVVPDGAWLATTLYSRRGLRFMDEISGLPQGYDRVDRLSRIPRGKQTIRDLLKNPGGYKLIEYMTTTPYGKNMGKMLSRDPGGANFNRPTGRIYTVSQLLDELEQLYKNGKAR